MTADELARFDEASNHPYECRCEKCGEWWAQVPPEDDEPDDNPYCACGHDTSEGEEVDNVCDACGKPLS